MMYVADALVNHINQCNQSIVLILMLGVGVEIVGWLAVIPASALGNNPKRLFALYFPL
jgi:hypothetical protein